MKAIIIVPNTGEGKIEKIFSIEDAAGYTPEAGEKKIEVDAPGIPIDSIHWDGSAVAAGAYLTPEEIAENENAMAKASAGGLVEERYSEAISLLCKVFIRESATLNLTTAETALIESIVQDCEALEALE